MFSAVYRYAQYSLRISKKVLTIVLQRNHSYYTLTLLIPIMLLTLLAPVGLILPGIGLQLAFKLINSYHCMFLYHTLAQNQTRLSILSSCWWKNGLPNGSTLYNDDLCWDFGKDCSGFWQCPEFSPAFELFCRGHGGAVTFPGNFCDNTLSLSCAQSWG